MSKTLKDSLRTIREEKKLSLRDVEEKTKTSITKISNAYLSQLERGIAKKPSPAVLKELSKIYEFPYEALMRLAGYMEKNTKEKNPIPPEREARIALMSTGLSAEEAKLVMQYAEFIRNNKAGTNFGKNR